MGRAEVGAVTHKSSKMALITPSSDGIMDGKILVGLIYDDKGNNSKYSGIVYDIKTSKFEEKKIFDLLHRFDYENSIPINLTEVLKVSNIK